MPHWSEAVNKVGRIILRHFASRNNSMLIFFFFQRKDRHGLNHSYSFLSATLIPFSAHSFLPYNNAGETDSRTVP